MAGKSNISATFFAQKKLLGKAHTSNIKVDGEEVIGSNIQSSTSLLFGEPIPKSPARTLYALQSATGSFANTIEYIQFSLQALTGTTYNASNSGGGSGSDSGEGAQSSGPHTYKFVLPSNYESISLNPRKDNGIFDNSKLVHETLGQLQLVPPFYSQTAPNPYIVKIYKDNGGSPGDEIPLLDNIDWNIDYYNGILFIQDYKASKVPAFARAFAYVGKMAEEVISTLSGGAGDITDVTAGNGLTGGASSGAATINVGAGTGIEVAANSISIDDSVVATLSGSTFTGNVHFSGSVSEFTATGSVNFNSGLSGSLTHLTDGSSYLIAGSNITIASASNGAVTITSTGGDLDGSGAANRIATWSDSNSLTSDADFTWNGTLFNVQGDSVLNGTVVINQSGAAKDFRVESNNKSNAFEVDGTLDMVLIHSGDLSDPSGYGSAASAPDPKTFTDTNFFVSGSIDSRGSTTKGTSVFGGDVVVSGTLSVNRSDAGGYSMVTITTDGKVGIGTDNPGNKLSVGGNMDLGEYLYHKNDENTYMRFQEDQIHFKAGNRSMLKMKEDASDQVLILSGGHSTSPDPDGFADTNFFVSGTIGSKNSSNPGTAVFGGDLFVSGTSTHAQGLSGSLTKLVDGSSYMVAGNNITITSASNGAVTITSTASGIDLSAMQFVTFGAEASLSAERVLTPGDGITINTSNPGTIVINSTGLVSRSKKFFDVTSSWSQSSPFHPLTGINFANSSYDFNKIDVFYNGQALRSGSNHDYTIQGTGSIVFDFDLFVDDVILVTTF